MTRLGGSTHTEFRGLVVLAWERDSFFVKNWPEKTSPGPKGGAGGNTESPTARPQSLSRNWPEPLVGLLFFIKSGV